MIIDDLEFLRNAYTVMQVNGLLKSQIEFSRRFLLRDKSYLRSMWCRKRRPSQAVMSQFEWSLQQEIISYESNFHLGNAYAIHLNAAYDCLIRQLQMLRAHRKKKSEWEKSPPANDNTLATPISPSSLSLALIERQ